MTYCASHILTLTINKSHVVALVHNFESEAILLRLLLSYPSSSHQMEPLPSSDVRSALSKTLPYPIQIPPGQVAQAHHPPEMHPSCQL